MEGPHPITKEHTLEAPGTGRLEKDMCPGYQPTRQREPTENCQCGLRPCTNLSKHLLLLCHLQISGQASPTAPDDRTHRQEWFWEVGSSLVQLTQ